MLHPHEFFVGTLADAPHGTLLLPRTKYDWPFIVGTLDGVLYGIALSGEYAFVPIPVSEAERWAGLLIPDVSITVDHKSLIDTNTERAGWGTLVRRKSELAIRSRPDSGRFYGRAMLIPLVTDLPNDLRDQSAEFSRWQIGLGNGYERRVLFEIDSAANLANPAQTPL